MNKYYSVLRPVGIGTYPINATVKSICNFDRRMYVPEIGREAWGYIEFAKPLSRKNQMDYDLVPVGGMSFEQFRNVFAPVAERADIERLDRFALYGYKKAHSIVKVTPYEQALARQELIKHLFDMVESPDVMESLIIFVKATKIKADPHELGERLIDIKDSNMVNC